jgi:Predicted transcriptional regulators
MGTTKKELFSPKINRIADLAKAIGHPARIAILELLLAKQTCICGDLVDELPLSQSTISQHLRALKKVGIIQGQIDGVSVCYCIDPKVWEETKVLLQTFLTQPLNCC